MTEARGVFMRKTVHLCLSSHEEVMYRNEEDLIMGFNCLALAVLETESRLLGEGFMSTHNHILVQTDNQGELWRKERYAYSRYFNAKYYRKGRIGEKYGFSIHVEGRQHTITALDYVLRQGLHHGLSKTPFGYRHCSANSFFREDLGKTSYPALISNDKRHRYLPHGKTLPTTFRMSDAGLLLREDIIDTAYVEELYITPRNFLFHMNRISDEQIVQEQTDENNLPPVTLATIETGVPAFNLSKALLQEKGHKDNRFISDLEMCQIIDGYYLPRLMKETQPQSIYILSPSQRSALGNKIWEDFNRQYPTTRSFANNLNPLKGKKATLEQIQRCLALT